MEVERRLAEVDRRLVEVERRLVEVERILVEVERIRSVDFYLSIGVAQVECPQRDPLVHRGRCANAHRLRYTDRAMATACASVCGAGRSMSAHASLSIPPLRDLMSPAIDSIESSVVTRHFVTETSCFSTMWWLAILP